MITSLVTGKALQVHINKEFVLKYLILTIVLALSGCSSTPNQTYSADIASIMKLIAETEDKAPKGVEGTFKFHIKASGQQNGFIYLNTEDDYRDRRSITVAIHPKLIKSFEKKYGESPLTFFLGKTIEATGEIKQQKIHFVAQGRLTEKYYFQTHFRVKYLAQIKVVG